MSTESCIAKISKEFMDMDRELIREVVEEVERLRATSKSSVDFKKKSQAHYAEVKKHQARKLTQKVEDIQKLDKELSFVGGSDFKERPWEAVKSLLSGSDHIIEGGSRSIFMDAMTLSDGARRMLVDALEDEGLLKVAKSGALDREIYIAKHQMANKQQVTVSPEAQRIATAYTKLYNHLQDNMEISGSLRNRLDGYLKRSHDALKIEQGGFDKWKASLLKGIDPEESFGTKDAAKIESILKEDYENIILGEYDSGHTQSSSGKFIEIKGAGLDKRLSKKRVYKFKSGELEFAYMEEFGKGSTLENLLNSIERDSRNAASMNRLGSNPRLTYETIKSQIKKDMRGNPELSKKFKAKESNLDALFENTVTGFRHGSSALARYSTNTRSVVSMAMLGGAVIKAGTTDIATAASVLRAKTGKGILESYWKVIKGIGKNLSPRKRKILAKRMKTYTDNGLGEVFSRFNPDDAPGGTISKGINTFFKANLMKQQNDIWKSGNGNVFSNHLADISDTPLGSLNKYDKATLGRYGITSGDWDHIRTAFEVVEGEKLITPYAVDQLNLPAKQKRELRLKISAYLRESSEYLMSPTPGVAERNFFQGRVDPDSVAGQMVLFAGQFKSFGMSAVKVARHVIMSNPDHAGKSFGNIIKDDWRGVGVNMGNLMLGTTVMGAVGIWASDMVKGKTPRHPDNAEFWMQAMVSGGGMGLYGDFIFGEYDSNYRSLSQDVLGPVIGGSFNTAAEVWAGMRRGEPNAYKAFNLLINNVPYSNLFYTRAGLDYLFLDGIQENLSPGYKARKRKRMREQGQEWIIPKLLGD